ncbi:MAG TPA: LptF/LptG family permease [bacterium]|nr:LptF/LptG family permease [bacterium]HQO33165.1 LptF/LptG family permease [bacterium]HQP99931.1 LptF/LptG family permease [bacterium]
MKLLTRYVWSELVPSCGEGLVLLTIIFLLKQMFYISTRLLDTGAQLGNVVNLFIDMIPPVCLLTLPMSVLLGTLLSYGRLAEENEITAMESGGITLARIYFPAVLFGLLVTVFMLFWSHVIVPKSLRLTQQTMMAMLQNTATGGITPGQFKKLGELTLFCDRMNKDNKQLYGTTIFEKKKDFGVAAMVSAPTTDFQFLPEQGELRLDLKDVYFHRPRSSRDGTNLDDQIVEAARMYWTTNVGDLVRRMMRQMLKGGGWLTTNELRKRIQDEKKILKERLARQKELEEILKTKENAPRAKDSLPIVRNEIERKRKEIAQLSIERALRISLPFAAVLMAMVAAPLGVLMRRGRRGVAFGVTIVIVLIYYVLMSLGKALAAEGSITPWIGLWMPNFAALLLAAAAYRKTVYL